MAQWQCKQCKQYNPDEEESCDQCLAPRKESSGPRETCGTCFHRHSTGKSCHVFVVDRKSRESKAKKWNKPRVGGVTEAADGEGTTSSSSGDVLISGDLSDSGENSGRGRENSSSTDEEDDEEKDASSDETSEATSDSEESDEGSDEGSSPKRKKKGLLGFGDKLAAKAAAIAKSAGQALQSVKRGKRPPQHETPPWALEACLRRCNCGHGVPTNSAAFSSLQEGRTVQHSAVGIVTVRTEPLVGEDLDFENRRPLASMPPPPHALRLFLEYVDPRTVASCARVSTEWHRECYHRDEEGTPSHPAYVGLHFMELESSVDACQDKIDGLFFHQPPTGSSGQLFTSGQRSVTAWRRTEKEVVVDRRAGSTSSQDAGGSRSSGDSTKTGKQPREARKKVSWVSAGVTVRDTAPFTTIRPVNSSIICCSSNGSIREWSLAHEAKNTRFLAQMWEHNGYVTDVAFTAPSVGYCKAHGAPAHSCYMYSVSDDRYLKVWDLATKECLHTVKPEVKNCGTLQSVAKSDFHLYAGSSNGRIVVYALGRVCQRPEKHRCHLHEEPQWFCEQETFQHGTEPVQHMACGGVGGSCKYLFTGARDGSIQVWDVPKASFGHNKVCLFAQHKRAITALSLTKAHLFSASDEGHLRIWNLATLTLQRVVKQDRRIKCLWVHHAPPESPDAGKGSVFLGLATGLVLSYPITDAV